MRRAIVGSLASLLAGAGLCFGQVESKPLESTAAECPVTVCQTPCQEPCVCMESCDRPCPRWWLGAEYLMWWFKDQDVHPPLISTGVPGLAGTARLDPSAYDYDTASGIRVNAGRWFGDEQRFGLESSAFLFQRLTSGFATSDFGGTSTIGQPLILANGGGGFVPAAAPGAFAGGVAINTENRFWGAEVNMMRGVPLEASGWSNTMLLGFRYLDLNETLESAAPAVNLATNALGPIGTFSNLRDYWGGHNQFYGGQVGTRFEYQTGRFFVNGTAKVALGSTHQSVTVNGNFLVAQPGGATTLTPGGTYTGPTNIGRITQDEFTVVPELQLNVGYQIGRSVRTYVGYNYLYWSDVTRPGDQVDISVAPGHPAVSMNRTDFWAHGLNFGLEFRY